MNFDTPIMFFLVEMNVLCFVLNIFLVGFEIFLIFLGFYLCFFGFSRGNQSLGSSGCEFGLWTKAIFTKMIGKRSVESRVSLWVREI